MRRSFSQGSPLPRQFSHGSTYQYLWFYRKNIKNFLDFPKEPYGVSNNAKSKMGPPKYDHAKFTIEGPKIMDIKVD